MRTRFVQMEMIPLSGRSRFTGWRFKMDLAKRNESDGMKSFGRIALWRTCWAIILVMAYGGALFPSPAFGQKRMTREEISREFIKVLREEADQGNPIMRV